MLHDKFTAQGQRLLAVIWVLSTCQLVLPGPNNRTHTVALTPVHGMHVVCALLVLCSVVTTTCLRLSSCQIKSNRAESAMIAIPV